MNVDSPGSEDNELLYMNNGDQAVHLISNTNADVRSMTNVGCPVLLATDCITLAPLGVKISERL